MSRAISPPFPWRIFRALSSSSDDSKCIALWALATFVLPRVISISLFSFSSARAGPASSCSRTRADFERTLPTIATGPYAGETFGTTLYELDALSRTTRLVSPKGDEHLADYDGMSRVVHTTSPAFGDRLRTRFVKNEATFVYDGESNRLRATEIDRSPLAGVPDETFVTDWVLDAAGRPVRVTEPNAQTSRFLWDSRSNLIVGSDGKSSRQIADPLVLRGGPSLINDHGNVVRTFHDGLSRPVRRDRLMKIGGTGDGSLAETNLDRSNPSLPSGVITTRTEWDGNDQVQARVDSNGARTSSTFDALDRPILEVAADGSFTQTDFDADDLPTKKVMATGTTVVSRHDGARRLLRLDVTRRATNVGGVPGHDVLGTTLMAYEYDGMSRLRGAIDDNGSPSVLGVATNYAYDSIGRKVGERHRVRAAVSANDVTTTNNRLSVAASGATIDRTVVAGYAPESAGGVFPRTSLAYPTSGRTLTFGIDGLERTQTITGSDAPGTPIASYEFLGGRAVRRELLNGANTTFGYDANRRVTSISHGSSAGLIAAFEYGYDAANNRRFERSLHKAGSPEDRYSYDSAYRVVGVDFGVVGAAAPARQARYVLDGAHNFVSRTEDGQTTKVNTRPNGTYAPDALNRHARVESFDAVGAFLAGESPKHDASGARIEDARKRLYFDAFERLVKVERTFDAGATWQVVGVYTYDAEGRRVTREARVRDDSGSLVRAEDVAYVYDGDNEIEELRLSDGALVMETVFGPQHVDEPVQIRRGGQAFYLHANASFSVSAVSDASGQVVERYEERSIYGVQAVLSPSGAPRPLVAEIGNPWRFQGRAFDAESGLVFFRSRYLDPREGRFVSGDMLGTWGDAANAGNGFAFCAGNPLNGLDPFGLRGDTAVDRILGFFGWLTGTDPEVIDKKISKAVDVVASGVRVVAEPVYQIKDVAHLTGDMVTNAEQPTPLDSMLGYRVEQAISQGVPVSTIVLDEVKAPVRVIVGIATCGYSELAIGLFNVGWTAADVAMAETPEQRWGALKSFGWATVEATISYFTAGRFACFVAGTLVDTPQGPVPIEQIQKDDEVWTRDEATGEVCVGTVARAFERETEQLVTVTTGGDSIVTTPEHPFWVVDQGWVGAGRLAVGDVLITRQGEETAVAAVGIRAERAKVFNFEVAACHTYFVAARADAPAVWVHNACAGKVPPNSTALSRATHAYRTAHRGQSGLAGKNLVAATFEKGGRLITKVFKNVPGGDHSEVVMAKWFKKQGIAREAVKDIYSEFQPCHGGTENRICRTLVSGYTDSPTWSFPWSNPVHRALGRDMKRSYMAEYGWGGSRGHRRLPLILGTTQLASVDEGRRNKRCASRRRDAFLDGGGASVEQLLLPVWRRV